MKSKNPKKPFEINETMLRNLGWNTAIDLWGFARKAFPSNSIWFFEKEDMTYYISETVHADTMQYGFHSYRTSRPDEKGTQKIERADSEEIRSNAELFKKIIDSEACEESYARHFRISKLFKNG
jgi:hypothetical protein